MFRKISLASLGIVVGSVLFTVGLAAYFANNATLNLAGFFYGFPLILGGLALKAAELKPIPFTETTSPEVIALRQQQGTPTQNQLRQDITRYRYGQSAHLDETLKRLGLGFQELERPILTGLRETIIDGAYTLILQFDSPRISLEIWQQKQEKITTFFGPGIRTQLSQPEANFIELALITESQVS